MDEIFFLSPFHSMLSRKKNEQTKTSPWPCHPNSRKMIQANDQLHETLLRFATLNDIPLIAAFWLLAWTVGWNEMEDF